MPSNTASTSTDSLLDCLLLVALGHGRPLSRDAALYALPLTGGRLTPSLLPRAAERAGLRTRVVRSALRQFAPDTLPFIALLKDDTAAVVLDIDATDGRVRVREPARGGAETELALADFETRYLGVAILLRPEFRFDARAPSIGPPRERHWFWSVLRDNWPLYRDALFAAFLINLFAIALPLFVMNVYDRVVPNQAVETLWVLAIGVVIVLIGDLILSTIRGHFLDLAGNRVDLRLSAYIMERVLGLRMADRPVSAGSFAANLRSFELVRDFITSTTITALIDVPFALLFLIAIVWIAWPLVLVPLLGIIVVLLYARTVQKPLRELTETTYRAGALRNATLVESLVGLETVKAIGAESVMQRKWEESAAFLARTATRLRLLTMTTQNATRWAQQLVSVGLIVLGVYLIIDAKLSMGGLIAANILAGRALAALGQVTGLMMQYHNASTALTSLDQIMGRPVERPDNAGFVSRPAMRGEIEFKGVSFAYPEQESAALRDVSFRIHAGEKVAILGRIGSGKSTIHRLLLGLYQPQQGAVLVDGVDLRQIDPAELRRSIGYASQEVTLFYGTLRDNLRMGVPFASDDDLVRAVRVAGIAEFVNAHPRGFDMLVGERGETLSGGQRQAIGLARAVIGDPPILLLDEPTGSMDHSTEQTVKERLAESVRDKTVVMITHRNTLLDLVDRLIVIDGGKVVADGPKDRVVAALRSGQIQRAA
ncbi:type I secretion system permease/ATPase [Fontimonas sp. SYSU GA230001]|uniref:type I secretion system permease/ATPase n=1 Tax=Fontimonas sp. SYSU GA230001 TaxID=3142450 RepID=UPI0032B486B0